MRFSILILFLLFTTIFSQQLYEKQIYPFDGIKNDYFGFALSISDSFLFTSSIRYENTIDAAVYSYKYENNDYKFLNKIRPTIPEAGALFSTRILYQDNQLLVGAQNKKLNGLTVGALYVFELEDSVWIEKQVIYPPEPRTFGGLFSNVIVKYKNYLLVSAYRADAGEEDAGKVFLYEYINDNFELLREFVPHDPKEFQFFGTSLLMDDNLIVIGSQNDSTESGEGSGSIYVYEKTNVAWTFKSKYIPNQNSELLAYGCDLAMNDEYIIVGTTDNFNYNKPGQAYIYKYTGPKLELVQIITTGDNYSDDRFGYGLSIAGDSLLVGARRDTVKSSYAGAVYLFVNENGLWKRSKKIAPSGLNDFSEFGAKCVLRNGKIFVGAHRDKYNGEPTGALYIYFSEPLTRIQDKLHSPNDFYISQNYPNPFNGNTKFSVYLPKEGIIKVNIFDITGRMVFPVFEMFKQQGYHDVNLDFTGLTSGIYFYRVEHIYFDINLQKHNRKTKKVVLIK